MTSFITRLLLSHTHFVAMEIVQMTKNTSISNPESLIIHQSKLDGLVASHVTGFKDIQMLIPQELSFLRDLVSNGNWDYVTQFLSPFEDCAGHTHLLYLLHKQEFMEFISNVENFKEKDKKGEAILKKLEPVSSSREEYESLSLLLTDPSHPLCSDWSLKDSRQKLLDSLVQFLSSHMISSTTPTASKLVKLVARGLMYELCEKFILESCNATDELHTLADSDMLNLLDWLKILPENILTTAPPPNKISIVLSPDDDPQPSLNAQATPTTPPILPETIDENEALQSVPPPITSGSLQATPINDTPSSSSMSLNDDKETEAQSEIEWPKFSLAAVVKENQAVRAVSFSTNGLAAVGANTRTLRIYNTSSLLSTTKEDPTPSSLIELCSKTEYHRGSIYCLDWLYDSSLLASGSNDQSIHLMNCTDSLFQQVADLRDFGGTVRELRFLPSSKSLVACGNGQRPLQLLDVERFVVTQDFKSTESLLLSVTPIDTNTFICGGEKGSVVLWDIRSMTSSYLIHSFPHPVTSLSLHEDELACSTTSGTCYSLSLKSSSIIKEWSPHGEECRSIRYSPSGGWVLSSSYDGSVVLSDAGSYQWSVVTRFSNKVIQSRWDTTGNLFACTSADKTVSFWKNNNNNL